MIRGLIFDFDGLILDTEWPELSSWQSIYREHNCELALEVWSKCVGTSADAFNPLDHLEELLGSPVDQEALRQRHRKLFDELIEANGVLPGVKEYLVEAGQLGIKVGLASSASRQWVAGHLERLGLIGYFGTIKTREDVQIVKPDPELYLAALNELGLAPEEAIAFEDSPNGIHAARAAGMYCVAIPNAVTCTLPLEHAHMRLKSLAEYPLQELLARFG